MLVLRPGTLLQAEGRGLELGKYMHIHSRVRICELFFYTGKQQSEGKKLPSLVDKHPRRPGALDCTQCQGDFRDFYVLSEYRHMAEISRSLHR